MSTLFDKELFGKKFIEPKKRVPIDTLFLIGNGFDLWQGYDTSYAAFEKYYQAHLLDVLKRLHIEPKIMLNEDGEEIIYSDVELFFGDPKNPTLLPKKFWSEFESSLDKVDDQEINCFFGKTLEGLKNIQHCAANAQKILRELFADWISELQIVREKNSYNFGDNCLFINFNYTNTLVEQFRVKEENEFHIHGDAKNRNSIIFGHATHPEEAFNGLKLGTKHPRFQGLYYIEEALYNLDKHVEDNYMKLKIFLALHGALIEDIKKIYVLGFGFGNADIDYIRHLIFETQSIDFEPESSLKPDERKFLDNADSVDIFNLNIQYAIEHRKRILKKEPIPFPKFDELDQVMEKIAESIYYDYSPNSRSRLNKAVVRRRFLSEQERRNKKIIREYLRLLNRKIGCNSISLEDAFLVATKEKMDELNGAKWIISYYSEKDYKRINEVMAHYGCNDFSLRPSIMECLEDFK